MGANDIPRQLLGREQSDFPRFRRGDMMNSSKSVGNLPDASDSFNNTGRDIEMSLAAIFSSAGLTPSGPEDFFSTVSKS